MYVAFGVDQGQALEEEMVSVLGTPDNFPFVLLVHCELDLLELKIVFYQKTMPIETV